MIFRQSREIFDPVLLTPLTRGDAKAFFEKGVEQTERPIAALESDINYLGV